jgi:hypothetical protein
MISKSEDPDPGFGDAGPDPYVYCIMKTDFAALNIMGAFAMEE